MVSAARLICALYLLPPIALAKFTIQLDKQHVPVVVDGRQVATKTAYFGTVFVGLPEPQRFTVVFDTGSGHVFLPSTSCEEDVCAQHRRYNRSASLSAVDLAHDGSRVPTHPIEDRDQVSISYGTGEIVGEFTRETVCIADPIAQPLPKPLTSKPKADHCVRVRVVLASEMSADPFQHFLFDGVIGLGLKGLALHPGFHFFGEMVNRKKTLPLFSFFIARGEHALSEITFGGYDERRIAGPLSYVAVANPEQGHWRVAIQRVRVGNETLLLCEDGSCTAIVDTGTSILGVPHEAMSTLMWQTARKVARSEAGASNELDCRTVVGPPLIFEMEGGLLVQLEAEDYSRPAPSTMPASALEGDEAQDSETSHAAENQTFCHASLLPVNMPALGQSVFLWGAPVLMKYYTSYDVGNERVGFAPAVHSDDAELPVAALRTSSI